jgi:hypothetical protein
MQYKQIHIKLHFLRNIALFVTIPSLYYFASVLHWVTKIQKIIGLKNVLWNKLIMEEKIKSVEPAAEKEPISGEG